MRTRVVVKRPERVVFQETPEIFFGEKMQKWIQGEIERKQWIYKVIDGKQEENSVILNTENFMILPDMEVSGDGKPEHWLAIFKDTDLLSNRYLNGSHLPLLHSIRSKIIEKFSNNESLMMYFHHPPSVWQLHLHISTQCDTLRSTNDMQKVCFLDDVISQLTIDPDYYRKASVTYVLPATHELIKTLNYV